MKFISIKGIVTGLIFIFLSAIGYSQNVEKKVFQTAFAKTAPVIDGLMNDDCWNLVGWGSDFIQIQPVENKPPSQQTAFKILYDDNNLYLFIRAYDKEPDKISRIMSRRDNFDGDMVFVDIDSYFDKQTDFLFAASASGAKSDAAISDDGNNEDDSWNPVWYLKTSVDAQGWCAEMRIPLSQLRFGKKAEQIWGLQVTRSLFRLQERSQWQYIPKGSPGIVHLYGELHGINDIKPKHQVELMPYSVARMERFEKEAGNPFMTGKSSKISAGLDGKAAVTNDLTLDFSFNPDFGQVEADPSVVNLTAFETYFSEQRPLFVEGKSIFQFQPSSSIVINNMYSDNLFYSRRIGRNPQYYPATSGIEYVKMPESSRIIGALKLSGKTKKGLSIGILESVTSNENAIIDSAGTRRKESVEPMTNYFVARLQQDFNKGETVLGGIFTAVNRDITNPALNFMHRAAYTGGIDFKHNWKDRTWYFAGNAEFSEVTGKPEAIINTQTSSARYYQRPDANYLSVDSTLTSLPGYGGTFKFGKSSKKHLQFETSLTVRSPGLELNDIGYMRYSDIIHHGSWVAYYIRDPFAIFNNFYLNTNYWMYWNFSGKLLSTYTNMNFNTQLKNLWRINGNITRESENISTNFLRGGPSFTMPGGEEMNLNINSNQSKKVAVYFGNYNGFGDANSTRAHEFYGGVTIRPSNSISVTVEPDYSTQNTKLQYVGTAGTSQDPKYLFAQLNQKTLGFTLRLNYTVNPELSIEYYGQPFISAGKYKNFKKITDPDAGSFKERFHTFTPAEIGFDGGNNRYIVDEDLNGSTDYAIGNPDFNFRQFRSNLVVRWEYRPGSTLYLVWSQGRTSNASNGIFSYGNDMKDLFGITPHNVFLVKFSYWFSL